MTSPSASALAALSATISGMNQSGRPLLPGGKAIQLAHRGEIPPPGGIGQFPLPRFLLRFFFALLLPSPFVQLESHFVAMFFQERLVGRFVVGDVVFGWFGRRGVG